MADLLINVRPSGLHDDGDIVCAYSDDEILRVHAERLCAPATRRAGQRHARGGLWEALYTLTHRFQFERIGTREVRRTNLLTGASVVVDAVAYLGGVEEARAWVRQRLAHDQHAIFGDPGADVWFEGHRRPDVSAVWDVIEARTPHRRQTSQFAAWPFTETERRQFLPIRVSGASTSVVEALASSWDGADGTTLRTRRYFVPWRDLLRALPATAPTADATIAAVLDPLVAVDLRPLGSRPYTQVVRDKAAP